MEFWVEIQFLWILHEFLWTMECNLQKTFFQIPSVFGFQIL